LKSLEQSCTRNNSEPREDVTFKVKDLQQKIQEVEAERNKLLKDRDSLDKDKESQIKALQDALDDALETKIKLQTKYEKELRELQDSNSSLVDDFEWKLRQIESTCRKKLQDKDRQVCKLSCYTDLSR
jgi:t-SNARE complex subunit (syntaxin)